MKLSAVKDSLLTHICGSGARNPERISEYVMEHVIARTRWGSEAIGGHTYISAGNCVVIVSYDNNGLVKYISRHSTKPGVEDVRK